VDTDLFKPREKDFLPGERPLTMFVGRVAVEKNLEAYLSLDLPGTKYVVGDGPAMTELQRKYPEVRFTGAKRGEELARHMAAADVFVFPSLTDTFGVVMLEAGACGVPVAAYPVTGPKNVVINGVNGYLDEDLDRAVEKALSVSAESCQQNAKKYSWDVSTQQFYSNLAFQ
jgi:glycosyltransferase involved in cell wall biosynthesis